VSNTTTHGYSASLGPPEGRYIAPANSADCLQVRAGDCAPAELIIRAPWFSRVDFGVTKKFPMGGTRNVEVRFDMLNLFDNINFNAFVPSFTTSNAAYFGRRPSARSPAPTPTPATPTIRAAASASS
jgi:hypothetical protein